jgi:hypothetical protein
VTRTELMLTLRALGWRIVDPEPSGSVHAERGQGERLEAMDYSEGELLKWRVQWDRVNGEHQRTEYWFAHAPEDLDRLERRKARR